MQNSSPNSNKKEISALKENDLTWSEFIDIYDKLEEKIKIYNNVQYFSDRFQKKEIPEPKYKTNRFPVIYLPGIFHKPLIFILGGVLAFFNLGAVLFAIINKLRDGEDPRIIFDPQNWFAYVVVSLGLIGLMLVLYGLLISILEKISDAKSDATYQDNRPLKEAYIKEKKLLEEEKEKNVEKSRKSFYTRSIVPLFSKLTSSLGMCCRDIEFLRRVREQAFVDSPRLVASRLTELDYLLKKINKIITKESYKMAYRCCENCCTKCLNVGKKNDGQTCLMFSSKLDECNETKMAAEVLKQQIEKNSKVDLNNFNNIKKSYEDLEQIILKDKNSGLYYYTH